MFLQNTPTYQTTYEDQLWSLLEKGMGVTQQYIKTSIHPSSAYCSRFNTLTLNETVDNNSSPELSLYAQLGNCIEDFVAKSLIETKRLIVSQYRCEFHESDPELPIGGLIDLIYFNQQNKPAILEVKSTKNIGTKENYNVDGKKSKAIGIADSGPTLSHKTQAEIYAGMTGIEDVSILYISRNVVEEYNGGIAHYIHKIDTSADNLLKVFIDLYYSFYCWKEKVIPTRPSNFRKTVECKNCNLNPTCFTEIKDGDFYPELYSNAQKSALLFINNRKLRYQQFCNQYLNV